MSRLQSQQASTDSLGQITSEGFYRLGAMTISNKAYGGGNATVLNCTKDGGLTTNVTALLVMIPEVGKADIYFAEWSLGDYVHAERLVTASEVDARFNNIEASMKFAGIKV